jgi:ankyrin repeat protein
MSQELYRLCRKACCYDEKNVEKRWNDVEQWMEERNGLLESVHYKDEYASNCLHYVVRSQPPSRLVQKLLQFAPELVKEQSIAGWLPLHVALYNKASYSTVKVLLMSYPKSVQVQNVQGLLPLHIACSVGTSLELLDLLLLAYPESIGIKDIMGTSPPNYLSKLVYSDKSSEQAFLLRDAIIGGYSMHLLRLLLIAFPESYKKQDNSGKIPLHHACSTDSERTSAYVIILLDADSGAESLSVKDFYGKTPLQLKDENERLPLHRLVATSSGVSLKYLKILVNSFPESIATPDKFGYLPFHYACLNPSSSLEILMFFILMSPEVLYYFL